MLVIPAIDIKDNKVVRLYKGDYAKQTIYSDQPEKVAKQFEAAKVDYIHIVDLDGAKEGKGKNSKAIEKVREAVKTPIEVGGGIRDEETIKLYLEKIGIDRVILGTIAVTNPDFVQKMINKYGNQRILVGVDVKEGYVSISGWTETSTLPYIDFIQKMQKIGVTKVIVTDISKDGTLKGPNYEMYQQIKKKTGIDFVISGGVKSSEDVYQAAKLDCYGCIIGKAFYEGKIKLEEVMECLKKESYLA